MMKIAALVIAMLCASPSFAAQSGLGIGGRLLDHQHTTYGDGGILQGLSPVGPFLINTNNAGNINISTSLAGTIFLWKPNTANFTAGQFTTSQGAYSVNLGSYTFNLGAENKAQAHYSGALGYGNTINGFRYNAYAFGNYLTNTANNSLVIGNGYNLYPYSVSNSTGTTKIYAGRTEPELAAGATGIEISTLIVRGYISVNGDVISTSPVTDTSKLPLTGGTLSGNLAVDGGTFSVGVDSVVITGGEMLIGISNPATRNGDRLSIVTSTATWAQSGGSTGGINIERWSADANAPALQFIKGRSAVINTITAADYIRANDPIGSMSGRSYDNAASLLFFGSMSIRADQDADGASKNFGRFQWNVGNGAGATTEKMRLNSVGLGISTGTPQATLDVNGNALVRSTMVVYGTLTVSTSATSTDSFCFLGAVDNLPTTGYARGCLAYLNTDPTKIYLSTEAVVGLESWLGK